MLDKIKSGASSVWQDIKDSISNLQLVKDLNSSD